MFKNGSGEEGYDRKRTAIGADAQLPISCGLGRPTASGLQTVDRVDQKSARAVDLDRIGERRLCTCGSEVDERTRQEVGGRDLLRPVTPPVLR